MTRPWNTIVETYARYSKSIPYGSMLPFVRQIEQSEYASGLFGWTSMFDLYIVQTPVEYPYDGPRLKIGPKPGNKIEFRYIDSYSEEKQWHRTVNADDAFARLEGFLDQLHWFVKYQPDTQIEREES